ncbi:hypothetical protein L7F22_012690 [Adiantum nelumboides]|nr:hypothetical protein [Adiantum nelumboides]
MAATACMCLVPSPASVKQPSSSLINKTSRPSFFTVTCESSSPKPTRRIALTSLLLCGTAASVPAALGYAKPPFYIPMFEGPDMPGFKTMDTGVMLQDIVEGSGATAGEKDSVEFNYVCRRANGYFVYSTVDQFTGESSPVTLPLSGGKMIAGLKSILVGMRPGGQARLLEKERFEERFQNCCRKAKGCCSTLCWIHYHRLGTSANRVWTSEESALTCQ